MAPSNDTLFVERSACPICNSDRLATLFEVPYTDHRVRGYVMSHYRQQGTVNYDLLDDIQFVIHKCGECDLIFQRMAPADPMIDIIYNQFIDPVKLKAQELSLLTTENFQEIGRRLADLFETIGKQPKDIKMLDYAFGYGRWARVAVAMGAQVYVTEVTPEKIAFAQSIGVTPITEAELSNRQFDVVHAEQIFEHLTYPAETFAKLAQCVVRGGVFKIAVPKRGRIERLLKTHGFIDYSPYESGFRKGPSDYHTVAPLEHINAFSRKPIEYLARRGGFVVRTGSFGARHLDIDAGSFRAFASSCRAWGVRVTKDLYVRIGPGKRDNSCYLLFHDAA